MSKPKIVYPWYVLCSTLLELAPRSPFLTNRQPQREFLGAICLESTRKAFPTPKTLDPKTPQSIVRTTNQLFPPKESKERSFGQTTFTMVTKIIKTTILKNRQLATLWAIWNKKSSLWHLLTLGQANKDLRLF